MSEARTSRRRFLAGAAAAAVPVALAPLKPWRALYEVTGADGPAARLASVLRPRRGARLLGRRALVALRRPELARADDAGPGDAARGRRGRWPARPTTSCAGCWRAAPTTTSPRSAPCAAAAGCCRRPRRGCARWRRSTSAAARPSIRRAAPDRGPIDFCLGGVRGSPATGVQLPMRPSSGNSSSRRPPAPHGSRRGRGVARLGARLGPHVEPRRRPSPRRGRAEPAPVAQAAQSRRRRAVRRTYNYATTSSPIARNRSGSLVWSVNPGNDTRLGHPDADEHASSARIRVGDEPQSIALDPSNRYAFVANAAGSTRLGHPDHATPARTASAPRCRRTFRTGAEPWNIVISPDGRRVFVANSGQDTITVINARSPRDHRPRQPAPAAAATTPTATATSSRAAWPSRRTATGSTSPASCPSPSPAGARAPTTARRAWSAGSTSTPRRATIDDYRPRRRITLASQVTGLHDRLDRRRPARPDARLPEPAAEHRHPRQPGLPAEHRRLAGRPAALRRQHAGLRQRHSRRARRHRPQTRARRASSTCTSARATPSRARRSCSSPTRGPWPSPRRAARATPTSSRRTATCWSSSTSPPTGASRFTGDADTTRYIDLNDPANPATSGAQRRQEPAGHRHEPRRAPRLRHELRLAQRLGRRHGQRPRHQGHPHGAAARPGLARGGRPRRRGDVLLLARQLRPAGERGGVDRRAPVAGRLAELRQLPLQGPDRRRGLGVRRRARASPSRSTRRSTRATSRRGASSTTPRSSTRSRTSRRTSATSRARARCSRPAPLRRAGARPPAHEPARPQPRPAHRRQRRRQPRALHPQQLRQAQRRTARSSR